MRAHDPSSPVLQACLNGDRPPSEHPRVPRTPAELARDAAEARAAGAAELHLHPRGADGAETLEPDAVAACLDALRAAVPGMPVGVGTGAWIAPGGPARLAHVARWRTLPDYASVNLGEADAADTMGALDRLGVGIEAGLWNRADAERFIAMPRARECLRVLVEMTDDDPGRAMAEGEAVLATLGSAGIDLPILLHGEGGSVWAMVREAARRGLSTRVGLEDGLHLPDGTVAPDNAALVAAAVAVLREVAS